MPQILEKAKDSAGEEKIVVIEDLPIKKGIAEYFQGMALGLTREIIDFNSHHQINKKGERVIKSIYAKPLNVIQEIRDFLDYNFSTPFEAASFIEKSNREIFFPDGMLDFLAGCEYDFRKQYLSLSTGFKLVLGAIFKNEGVIPSVKDILSLTDPVTLEPLAKIYDVASCAFLRIEDPTLIDNLAKAMAKRFSKEILVGIGDKELSFVALRYAAEQEARSRELDDIKKELYDIKDFKKLTIANDSDSSILPSTMVSKPSADGMQALHAAKEGR
jgi:hypothetical protein